MSEKEVVEGTAHVAALGSREVAYQVGTRPTGIAAVFDFLLRLWKLDKLGSISGLFLLLILLVVLFPAAFATHDPYEQDLLVRFERPGSEHWLGTDQVGRDLFSRVIYGTKLSVAAGFFSVLFSMTLGTLLGLTSGFFGGRLDNLLMRGLEIVCAFPGPLLAILIVATLGPGIENVIIALVVFSVPEMARVVRAQVLSLREQEFVVAAQAIGVRPLRIMLRHLVPNTISAIVVVATLRLGMNILVTAGLSFIGLGVPPPTPEWGSMIATGRIYLRKAPHLVSYPGLAILVTVLAVNFLGDGLNQVTNPRLRHKQ
jgi:ABC-type dipeptide/oligopeptide/nickel transport system permease subunit